VAPVQGPNATPEWLDETRPTKAGSVTGAVADGASHPAQARNHGLRLAVVCGFNPDSIGCFVLLQGFFRRNNE